MSKGLWLCGAILFSISAWAGEDDASAVALEPPEPRTFELLFLGNSHSAANDLPGLVSRLVTTGLPGSQVRTALAPGYRFLDERIDDGETDVLLNSRPWTHVVLQAQKYSTSGQYSYPTDAAEEWIRRARARQADPILFPEWPRRGNTEEGPRVHELHLSIAAKEAACVAPIGLAWEASLAQNPQLALHAADGNHSNPTGALLTAYVLYEVITGQPASGLPQVPSIAASAAVQQSLREVASDVIAGHHETCPQLDAEPGDDDVVSAQPHMPIPSLGAWGTGLLILAVTGLGIAHRFEYAMSPVNRRNVKPLTAPAPSRSKSRY